MMPQSTKSEVVPCRPPIRGLAMLLIAAHLVACASQHRLEVIMGGVPAGSLQLGQVMYIGPAQESRGSATYKLLLEAGLAESELQKSQLAMLRIYCCGGPSEEVSAPLVYLPSGLRAKPGDVVEFRNADKNKKGTPAGLNVAMQVRQRASARSGTCRWDPPDERLWMRVLYADWMPAEGWEHQGGLSPAWYKRPPN